MKIKKRNVLILLCSFILILFCYLYSNLQPIFQIQTKTYFHEKVMNEIMGSVEYIEVLNDFVIQKENRMSVDTNQLNEWIVQVNQLLNEKIQDEYVASIPIGYLSGNMFFQNVGPHVSASFLISNRILAKYDIKTTTLGINNALIELILHVECNGDVIIGFDTIPLTITQSIPLAVEYVQGDVPQIFPY